jgi:hypothetical protein
VNARDSLDQHEADYQDGRREFVAVMHKIPMKSDVNIYGMAKMHWPLLGLPSMVLNYLKPP